MHKLIAAALAATFVVSVAGVASAQPYDHHRGYDRHHHWGHGYGYGHRMYHHGRWHR